MKTMNDLERARAHLQWAQYWLLTCRRNGHVTRNSEDTFLAALSWVWEEQEKARIAETAAIIEKYCLPIPALDPTMIDWQAFFGMRA
jgi:hypothetical protein